MRHTALVSSVLVCIVLLTAATASGQDERTRVFLRFQGDAAQQLEALSLVFEGQVLKAGNVEFAGTSEMDTVYADCRDQMGVGAGEERECRLQAARRVFVDEMLELSANKTKAGTYRVALTVWNTDSNAKVFAALVTPEEKSAEAALEAGLPELANQYLCFHGVARACDTGGDEAVGSTEDSNGGGDIREVRIINQGVPAPGEPVIVSEDRFSDEARQIVFHPHEDTGYWSLHKPDNAVVCELPCTRYLDLDEDFYVAAVNDNGEQLTRIMLPHKLPHSAATTMEAYPDLDSDWQDWEVTTAWLVGAGVPAFFGGFFTMFGGMTDDNSTQTAIGGAILGLGMIAYSGGAIYGGYKWMQSDGKDHLRFEKAKGGTAAAPQASLSWTTTW